MLSLICLIIGNTFCSSMSPFIIHYSAFIILIFLQLVFRISQLYLQSISVSTLFQRILPLNPLSLYHKPRGWCALVTNASCALTGARAAVVVQKLPASVTWQGVSKLVLTKILELLPFFVLTFSPRWWMP